MPVQDEVPPEVPLEIPVEEVQSDPPAEIPPLNLPKQLSPEEYLQFESKKLEQQHLFCLLHPSEKIKYYCRDDKSALCPECVVYHARHDFIMANQNAS